MNRTIKEATVKRYHCDSHTQLAATSMTSPTPTITAADLRRCVGLTPYEYICKIWATEPERFTLNPHHQMPGLKI